MTTACAGFGPPPPELLQRLSLATPGAGDERRVGLVELDAPSLSGEFKAILMLARGRPSVRLQLLPDLGGKVLDLAADRNTIVGYFPHANVGLEHEVGGGEPLPRHVLVFLAASLLEHAAPLTPERVRDARRTAAGWELRVDPVLAGLRLVAVVTEAGELVERRYYLRGARWTERFAPEHRITGQGFEWTSRDERVAALAELPRAIFELRLPAGVTP